MHFLTFSIDRKAQIMESARSSLELWETDLYSGQGGLTRDYQCGLLASRDDYWKSPGMCQEKQESFQTNISRLDLHAFGVCLPSGSQELGDDLPAKFLCTDTKKARVQKNMTGLDARVCFSLCEALSPSLSASMPLLVLNARVNKLPSKS